MDVIKAIETYVTRMVSEPSAMKVLLLDSHTVRKLDSSLLATELKAFSQDTYSVPGVNAVNITLSSSLSHRPHRQLKTGSLTTHEMRLLSPEQRQ